MDKLSGLNFGAVKEIGNKLAALDPFAKQTSETSAEKKPSDPPAATDVSEEDVETSTEKTDNSHAEPERSSITSDASIFSQALNPMRNLGSKIGDFVGQATQTTEKEEGESTATNSLENKEGTTSEESAADKFKTFGSSLFSYGKMASQTMMKSTNDALTNIKKSVEERSSMVSEFSKEQERFLEEKKQTSSSGPAVPPWSGAAGGPEAEEQLRLRILELSADERTVLRPVPSGQTFEFDMRAHSSIANLMLSSDPRLNSLRFKFVPKRITEENFWRNYFYRVSLLKQTTDLTALANNAVASAQGNTALGPDSNSPSSESPVEANADFQEELERAVQQELNEYELVDGAGEDVVDDTERSAIEAEILAEIGDTK